jgi:pimeloyl-ACP methyl ester carboxylesterase
MMLIHGGAHSGACYLATPDGRPGWAHAFARHGFRCVVPDWPGIGRSGYIPFDEMTGEVMVKGLGGLLASLGEPTIVLTHSMSGAYGWKLLEQYGEYVDMIVGVAPSAPGNIQPEPVILNETADRIDVQLFEGAMTLNLNRRKPFVADREFVERKFIGQSQRFPRDHFESYMTALIATPPILALQRANVGGSQLKVCDFRKFVGKRALILTGTADLDHPVSVDKPIADWLRQNGVDAEFVYLGDRGIVGNGHMMMLESNSDEIADLIVSWIETRKTNMV